MKVFRLRNIIAYLPLKTAMQDVRRHRPGYEWIERRNVTSPLISGCVLLPDFEADVDSWKGVDGAVGILRFGDFTPSLTPQLFDDIRKIEELPIRRKANASASSKSAHSCPRFEATN
jgi:hypothetical protein